MQYLLQISADMRNCVSESRLVQLAPAKPRDVWCSSGTLRILANVSRLYSYCSVTTVNRWSVFQKTGKLSNF